MRDYLMKHYPNLFKIKEVRVEGKNKIITYKENEPIVVAKNTHYEVRKLKDSSPLILSNSLK